MQKIIEYVLPQLETNIVSLIKLSENSFEVTPVQQSRFHGVEHLNKGFIAH